MDNPYICKFDKRKFFMRYTIKIPIKKVHPSATIPTYATKDSMGMDVKAVSCTYIKDIDVFEYDTGLAFEIPSGYGMFLAPRSSNTKTEYYIPNSPGVIDADYRGTVKVRFKNRDYNTPIPPYNIGDRIAQIIILPYPIINFIEVDELSQTERGTGSHGSTGK